MNGRSHNKLRRLLEIRRYQETLCRQELGVALRREQDAVEARGVGERLVARAQQGLRQAFEGGGSVDPRQIGDLLQEVLDQEELTVRLGARVMAEEAGRRQAEQEFRSARMRSRSLERLDEKRTEEAALLQRRTEQKDADEVALRRFQRGSAANRDSRPAEEEIDV